MSDDALPLVSTHHIHVRFGQKIVLTDINISVKSNEIVTLIGPNGAGKSTLVRTVLGLIKPFSGQVQLKPRIRIGYMPQRLAIEPFMPLSVQRFLHLVGPLEEARFNAVVKELTITHILEHPIQTISGGELQRVLLARAMLKEPDLLVLDEPVQGVDITGQEELYRLIAHIRDTHHCGILMVSHDLHLVMKETDSVVCLNNHICCSGHPEAVSHDPKFLNLFGLREPPRIAIYAHKHNHQHDLKGDICS